ncbi:hypothetical protein [uncultured Endozoicomonas sp.]|uniref:hypothetical protein n=1 Tax=uncultured Endozoicomonas sp. TaxID=432652 RepID=UPI00262DDAA2|nr:hypothetical protein [uncultured Endozoicomonas sp.]
MDMRHTLGLLLFFSSLYLSSAAAQGPLEPVTLPGQCLQAGAFKPKEQTDTLPKWLLQWHRARRGYIVTLTNCDQHRQQEWINDDGSLTGMEGELAALPFKQHVIPVIKKGRTLIKTFPIQWLQGRLVYKGRDGQTRCLIPKNRFHFEHALLEDCLQSPDLREKSHWYYAMPPAPGEEGKIGLAGIDSDQDGVRDDVQRFIASTFQDEPTEKMMPVSKMVMVRQEQLIHAYDKQKVLALLPQTLASQYCFFHHTQDDFSKYRVLYKRVEAKLYNTYDRLQARNKINSYYGGMIVEDPGDYEKYCNQEPVNTP